ncbi:MAG: hypothetical protein KQI35_15495 [Bacteroidetes bacterium]|nr:hypothetical protein [Bacteroidota bacterium]
MKFFITFIMVFIFGISMAQNIGRMDVREMYFEGWTDQCGAEELTKTLDEPFVVNDAVLMAYKGAALTTMANCKKMPTGKLSVFNKGKDWIEKAVVLDPENIEVRFIRFTVQTNVPEFLKYDDRESDKKFILENLTLQKLSAKDPDLEKRIVAYLMESGNLTEEEQEKIEFLTAGG